MIATIRSIETRWAASICLVFMASGAAAQTYDVVHQFAASGAPQSRLILATDGYFYGTTRAGGPRGVGTIFRMDSSGAVTTMHSFDHTDGALPDAALLQADDGNFYGTASQGGTSNVGTVFKMDATGHVTVLHHFGSAAGDGANPEAPLIRDGTDFYGTTFGGGPVGNGTIFRMDATGSVTVLHSFAGGDGAHPYAALVKARNGYFYGTTSAGGTGFGTVFKMDAAGNVSTIHAFTIAEGGNPRAALVEIARGHDALYGTTTSHTRRFCKITLFCKGHCSRLGCFSVVTVPGNVFRVDSEGSFSILHTFLAGEGTGAYGGLVEASSEVFYGTMALGGPSAGTVFRLDGNLTTLHSFTGPDGANPYAGLLKAADGNFYGTTSAGGASGIGTIFKMDASGTLTSLHSFAYTDGSNPQAPLIQAPDGAFYGTTSGGGDSNHGTIFKIDAPGALSTLHGFTGADGANPSAALLRAVDGFFYGTALNGGANGYGAIFKADSSGNLTTLHSFDNTDGAHPAAALIQDPKGDFLGTTQGASTPGNPTYGTIFQVDSFGALTGLYSFNGPDGSGPNATLLRDSGGNLFGTTGSGGTNSLGTVFKLDSSHALATLYNFAGADGANPEGPLLSDSAGNLYGETSGTSDVGYGSVFKLDSSGTVTTVHGFSYADGSGPRGSLVRDGSGNFYGTAYQGGANGSGSVFKISSDGSTFSTLHSFSYADGANPAAGLLLASDGSLWGTASSGGLDGGGGVVFRVIRGPASFDITAVAPTSGPATGGTPVTIAGTNFKPSARVMIGSAPALATPQVDGATSLRTSAPPLSPGTLNDATVINADASFGTGKALWFADFLDVPSWDGFHAAVEKLVRLGITSGCGNGYYCRDSAVTRAQMAVLLLTAMHGPAFTPPACTGIFMDVACSPDKAFAADWIEELYGEGITGGCSNSPLLFCPDASLTRAQMAVLLLVAKHGVGYAPPACTGIFADVACAPVKDFAVDWIERLYTEGITGGCLDSPHEYCPTDPATRGQLAVFLVATFGLP